jgi:hypothetical protein
MNEYRHVRRKEKHLFRKKKGQLDDQALIEIERHHSVQDSRKFYKLLNDTIKPFEPAVALIKTKCCQDERSILSMKPHTNQGRPIKNDVIIDLSSPDEIAYLKDNKAAGLDSIAAFVSTTLSPHITLSIKPILHPAYTPYTLQRVIQSHYSNLTNHSI